MNTYDTSKRIKGENMSNKLKKEFFLFAVVGVLNTLFNFLTYTFLVFFHIPYLIANIIGYGVGMANSYFLNKQFVFQRREEIIDIHLTL